LSGIRIVESGMSVWWCLIKKARRRLHSLIQPGQQALIQVESSCYAAVYHLISSQALNVVLENVMRPVQTRTRLIDDVIAVCRPGRWIPRRGRLGKLF
jgi:hypothetical protein